MYEYEILVYKKDIEKARYEIYSTGEGRTMELITPLGAIFVTIDGKPSAYSITELKPKEVLCPDIAKRYKLEVEFEPDGKTHSISCHLQPSRTIKAYPESGEQIEGVAYYSQDEKVKLSIIMEADSGYEYSEDGEMIRVCDTYDYDSEVEKQDNLVYPSYQLLSFTKTSQYVFGVSWILDCNEENDVQTWFGADPTIM